MKQILSFIQDYKRELALSLIVAVLIGGLLCFRLGSLTHGLASSLEVATAQTSGSWHAIITNPIGAPYTVLAKLLHLPGNRTITGLRLVSSLYALIAIGLFYIVARMWHSQRVALLASWLFVSSAWFLHVGRLASPDILWLDAILLIVVLLTPNKHGRQSFLALPSTLLGLAITLYVPGAIWLVVAGCIMQRKNFNDAWQATTSLYLRIVSIGATVLILIPLLYGFVQQPALLRSWLGLSSDLSFDRSGLLLVGKRLLSVPSNLLVYSHFDAVHWLGHLPLLTSFEVVMLLLGAYFYVTHLRAARTRLIMLLTLVSWAVVGLAGQQAISLIVPVVYLLVAAGIAYILHLWLAVFPTNPIARSFGICLVLAAVLLTSLYQTRSYFVAWRYNPDTKANFTYTLTEQ